MSDEAEAMSCGRPLLTTAHLASADRQRKRWDAHHSHAAGPCGCELVQRKAAVTRGIGRPWRLRRRSVHAQAQAAAVKSLSVAAAAERSGRGLAESRPEAPIMRTRVMGVCRVPARGSAA